MRNRKLGIAGSLAVATAALWMMSGALTAQSRQSGTSQVNASRTPDGHPDFTGMYDVATMTPLERPAELGNRLVLTEQEASALENYEADRNRKDAAPASGDRPAPPVGGVKLTPRSYLETLFRAGGGAVGGYNLFWLAPGSRVITVNGEKRSSIIVDPVDGKVPAMTADARKRNAAFLAYAVSPDVRWPRDPSAC
jgi:hypothetical protein